MDKLLEIRDLTVSFGGRAVVQNVSLEVEKGKIVMLVGESGSGKTTVLKSVLGLLDPGASVGSGEILFRGSPLPHQDKKKIRAILGKEIAVILQNPDLYLDPLMTIGAQYYEIMSSHGRISKKEARRQAAARLAGLGFRDPQLWLDKRPYELSGGMCQRAAIAIAMANQPALLLADEPTSALDVASGEEVMARLTGIRDRDNTTIFLVTHNMSVVSRYADSVGVMNQGFLVEWGGKEEILKDPRHPYTRMLLDSVPRLNGSLTGKAAVPSFCLSPGNSRRFVSETHWYLEREEAS